VITILLNYLSTEWGEAQFVVGGIRTLDFFSAIDKLVGEKGKKAVYYV
jgi:hypothetical protein